MKANEAPEKIYCESDGLGNIVKVHNIKWPDNEAENIEYTRIDVFLERACEWLKESITNNPECNRIISKKGVITMGELIKDFTNYMKGE